MKQLSHIELSSELIKKITSYFPSKKYKTQSHLFYEGQVPISGFLILDGSIQITHKRKFKKMLKAGYLLGVFELLNKKPIEISAEVYPDTEVCFLDMTTLLEVLKSPDNELFQLFKMFIEKRS